MPTHDKVLHSVLNIDWNMLSCNTNALDILEKNIDKVNWRMLSLNMNAVTIDQELISIIRTPAYWEGQVTVNGTFDIEDSKGSKIKFQVPASGQADIYIGELGIRCRGTVSVSSPGANGGVTLIVG